MPKGFYFLIGAQFASGLADNALLILGIYFLNEQGYPGWWAPLLKFSLTLAYVLLASVVGPLADAFSKSRLMACMNALKMVGVLLLLAGVHPLFAFALIGLAASVYAPAKYGLATEAVPARLLVRANAWIEVSMVLSVIFGIALGGALTGLSEVSAPMVFAVSTQTWPAMAVVIGVYLAAAMLNVGLSPMDKHGAIEPLTWHAVRIGTFWKSNQKLWRDPLGGVSLYVTTLYWGVGAVMQFAVLLWAQGSLGMTLKFGAYLQALVAIGVILGAYMAGRSFKLHSARQALPWGLWLAVLLPLMVTISNLWLAIALLLCVGVAGGMLLVPMNALLQHRGMQVLSSGRSIAVQGFNENLSVLLMLAAYSALLAFGMSLTYIMLLLAVLLVAGIAPLCLLLWRQFR
ncbi:lysophospholipid transporter LplT [Limnohabitans sp. INBF002]|uniref:lysophospholipid transporter LplT n=1 Tax=Limnohabitans sp. INBF002 TaxID=2986280 RepID=UPI0023777057|nr:lysophospholipid transporter LplT [Limnohabitans sp. INBF002]BDU53254.1 lysophospholipid transporter LplT [Limnohabitans sp. INBF002]